MTSFVLVPSPLLGPATWEPVADALVATGHRAVVVPVAQVAAEVAAGDDVVLVPHSNAGYWAPSLGERIVFVDAALPMGGSEETALASPEHLAFLEGLADSDGVLPPWTQWWDDLGDLFPSAAVRERIEVEQPRLPLSYFAQRVPVPPGWASRPCAYLAFGDTYAEEIAFARAHHWAVTRLDGGHLHQLHDPAGVAAVIVDLAQVAA